MTTTKSKKPARPTRPTAAENDLARTIYERTLGSMLTKVIDWDGGSNNLGQAKNNFRTTADYCRLAAEAFFEDP